MPPQTLDSSKFWILPRDGARVTFATAAAREFHIDRFPHTISKYSNCLLQGGENTSNERDNPDATRISFQKLICHSAGQRITRFHEHEREIRFHEWQPLYNYSKSEYSEVNALMMEAVQTPETSVNSYQSTRRYNPEDGHLHSHRQIITYFEHHTPHHRQRREHSFRPAQLPSPPEPRIFISRPARWQKREGNDAHLRDAMRRRKVCTLSFLPVSQPSSAGIYLVCRKLSPLNLSFLIRNKREAHQQAHAIFSIPYNFILFRRTLRQFRSRQQRNAGNNFKATPLYEKVKWAYFKCYH
jgi:hypothetical protein